MCSIVYIVLQIHSEILLMLTDYHFTFRTRTLLYIPVRKHFKLHISLSMALSQWLSALFVALSVLILNSTSQVEKCVAGRCVTTVFHRECSDRFCRS